MVSRNVANQRIRLVRLLDAAGFTQNPTAARRVALSAASNGALQLYWAIPSGLSAFAGPDGFRYDLNAGSFSVGWPDIGAFGNVVARERAAGLIRWKPQPAVRFVRVEVTIVAELLAGQRARTARFPDGLCMPDGAEKGKGRLAATSFSTPIRVAPPHALEAPRLPPNVSGAEMPDTVEILLPDVYLKESFANVLREHPELTQDVRFRLRRTQRRPAADTTSAASTITNQGPSPSAKPEAKRSNDPYDLKDRAPAVYALYRAAELCSKNPDYVPGRSAARKRKEIANETLKVIAQASPGLREVFQKTRCEYAALLIDPERDPNAGLLGDQPREWPTKAALKLLSQEDGRRQTFMNQTLELVIYAAEHWLTLPVSSRGEEKPRMAVLDDWLTKHGLTGAGERATLFPVITLEGARFQSAPKSPKP